MKILDISKIREAEAYTMALEHITSFDLMERAANGLCKWVEERFDSSFEFKIVCGPGNNGGDGLALARLLANKNYKVEVLVINITQKRSPDFLINFEKLESISTSKICIDEINSIESFQTAFVLNNNSIVIDALFGTGLKKPIEGLASQVVLAINSCGHKVISIDLPSGLFSDELNQVGDSIIVADHTLTFQFPKLSFMFPETAMNVGEFSIIDIKLSQDYIDQVQVKNYFVTKEDIVPLFHRRNSAAHKGNFGHSLLIAGSYGKIGAAILSSRACLRSGTGLLTVHVPECGYEIMQNSVPEAMVDIDSEYNFISDPIDVQKFSSIGVGPGIGVEKQTHNFLKGLIQSANVPIVFDADAINIISENKTWLSFLSPNSIFTPHLKEFERLAGKSKDSMDRLKLQRDFSIKYSVYVVLKGSHTSISCPDGMVFFNSTGNPGMAKGGSGDALTGIITSLIAQGYSNAHACIVGVFLHGLAGDFASRSSSQESMTPSDLIESLGMAFNFLRS